MRLRHRRYRAGLGCGIGFEQALQRAGLTPVKLSYKEGLALNNGTAQMLAMGVLAVHKLDALLATADLAAAMTIDAFAGRLGAFAEEVHALRPHPGHTPDDGPRILTL